MKLSASEPKLARTERLRERRERKQIKASKSLSSDSSKMSIALSSNPERSPTLDDVSHDSGPPPVRDDAVDIIDNHSQESSKHSTQLSITDSNSRQMTDSCATEEYQNKSTSYTKSRTTEKAKSSGPDKPVDDKAKRGFAASDMFTPTSSPEEEKSTAEDISIDTSAIAHRTRKKKPRASILDDRVLGRNITQKVKKSGKKTSSLKPSKVDLRKVATEVDALEKPTPLSLPHVQTAESTAGRDTPDSQTEAHTIQSKHSNKPDDPSLIPVGDDVDLSTEQREGIVPKRRGKMKRLNAPPPVLESIYADAPDATTPIPIGDDVVQTEQEREGVSSKAPTRRSQRLKAKKKMNNKVKTTKKTPTQPTRRSLPRSAKTKAGKRVINKVNFVMVTSITTDVPIKPLSTCPKSFKAAMTAVDRAQWKIATDAEFSSHAEQVTWNPTPIIVKKGSPLLKKTIMTKWVFNIKSDQTYKARLVARGDLQDESTYDITYSPTLRPEIARTIFAQNVTKRWFFKQYDFKTAYLNSLLNTEIYIYPPAGYSNQRINNDPNKRVIYKFNRGLYGLKQSGRLWHHELSTTLLR